MCSFYSFFIFSENPKQSLFYSTIQEYKKDLCASIEKILNKEVELFQRKLLDLMSLLVDVSCSPSQDAKTIFPDEWIHLEEALCVYNENLKRIRGYLQARLDSIYQPIEVELQEDMIMQDLKSLNDSKNALQVKISSHNQMVESLEATKNRLLSENTKIAYVENKTIIDQMKELGLFPGLAVLTLFFFFCLLFLIFL